MDRRSFLTAAGTVALAGCSAPVAPGGTPRAVADSGRSRGGATWPMFRYDPANTGHNDAVGPHDAVDEAWRAYVDGNITSSPAVVGGTLYTTGTDSLYVLDVDDGTERWVKEFQSRVQEFSPAVTDDRVFVGGVGENGGTLFALSHDGDVEWTVDVPITTSPLVVDGTVYFGVTTGETAGVHAVDAADGSDVARFDVDRERATTIKSLPAIVDGVAYVAAFEGTETEDPRLVLSAWDVEGDETAWTFEAGGYTKAPVTVSDGTVYCGNTEGYLHAVDAETGGERWRFESGSTGLYSSLSCAGGVLYLGNLRGDVFAIDPVDGTERWKTVTGIDLFGSAVGTDAVYVAGDPRIAALDRATGDTRWEFGVPGYSTTFYSPVLVGESLYSGACTKENPDDIYDNYVYRLGRERGQATGE